MGYNACGSDVGKDFLNCSYKQKTGPRATDDISGLQINKSLTVSHDRGKLPQFNKNSQNDSIFEKHA